MASLGFRSFMKYREGSVYLASVATPLVVHPGVRLSSTNNGFVCMVCTFFCMFGWLGLEPGFVCMVHTLNHLRGMGFSSRDQKLVPLRNIFVWDGLSLT